VWGLSAAKTRQLLHLVYFSTWGHQTWARGPVVSYCHAAHFPAVHPEATQQSNWATYLKQACNWDILARPTLKNRGLTPSFKRAGTLAEGINDCGISKLLFFQRKQAKRTSSHMVQRQTSLLQSLHQFAHLELCYRILIFSPTALVRVWDSNTRSVRMEK
jgi:hypothetical protein